MHSEYVNITGVSLSLSQTGTEKNKFKQYILTQFETQQTYNILLTLDMFIFQQYHNCVLIFLHAISSFIQETMMACESKR